MNPIALILAAALQLIPAPVSYTPMQGPAVPKMERVRLNKKDFRQDVSDLEPWQQQEAYRITIGKVLMIEALTEEGIFRARTTLRQLRELAGWHMQGDVYVRNPIPCGVIFDYPRFRHRGLMIDESRSFKGLDFLKKQIDAMALLKLNVLHLHLDDSAGWRIAIDSYPELTAKTAWRIGQKYIDWEQAKYRFTTADDPNGYGGFYTKDELRDLVAYAAERYITVIPEIEMPGHSMEVNRTYPELACIDASGRTRNFSWDLCPGNDGTIRLLEDILTEVIDIFPSKLIHIGGDEAVMKDWSACVNCRARMQQQGYTDVRQLQGYLVSHIAAWLKAHGRTAIGWDEILETGIPQDAVVMSWRGTAGGEKAAAAGHRVVMSPNTHLYFDYYQDLIRKEPLAVGELTSLHWVYTYDPGDDPLILGLQANLWCEKIPTAAHAEYMLYPRLFAIAEIGWTPKSHPKDAEEFRRRARVLLDLFRSLGYNTFDMDTETDFARAGLRRTQAGELIYPLF